MIIIAEKVIFLPQCVGRRVLGGCAAVRWHHLGGDAVSRRLRRGYFGSCAAVSGQRRFLTRIFTELCGFSQIVFICAMFCVICVFYYRAGSKGIQPKVERRGLSPSALSRGLSVSATLGMQATKRKRGKDANDHKKSVKSVKNRRSGVLLRRLACYYENILLVLLSILRLL